jgi:predicted DNA-binding ribbon-helix-helix protein
MNKSTVVKRSIIVGGHKTSVSLEDEFWNVIREISKARGMTLSELVAEIDTTRQQQSNLSSAVRLFVLDPYRSRAARSAGPSCMSSSQSGHNPARATP